MLVRCSNLLNLKSRSATRNDRLTLFRVGNLQRAEIMEKSAIIVISLIGWWFEGLNVSCIFQHLTFFAKIELKPETALYDFRKKKELYYAKHNSDQDITF